ncbi:hypothetical protein Rxycam_01852 [Rubrobacter xylanophilus DSM 9941]|uniref:DUF998 domain-containing protein n=1 Tax=Rubrobacter xylanophilus TaxID=49319 RepID=UPI001C642DEB|nr:DUF998 domain-containing protein [Rubrobacter xylanophilus]QYJ16022.1 hypothetical protein Rxycam_01852 [Rubrobacter xylanophilus DSM 9941]
MGRPVATGPLLACGVVGPPLFVVVFLVDGATRPGYDPWRHWVSHLGLGERGWLGVANLILFGLFMLGFSVGLRRALRYGRGSVWGPRLTAMLGLGLVLAGAFPTDPGLGYPPGTAQEGRVTPYGQVHDLAGALVFGSMTAVCFVLARRFAADHRWRGWTWPSIITGVVVAVSFVVCSVLVALDFAGALPGAPGGLFERVSLVSGGAWISLLALRLLRVSPTCTAHHDGRRRQRPPRGESARLVASSAVRSGVGG